MISFTFVLTLAFHLAVEGFFMIRGVVVYT